MSRIDYQHGSFNLSNSSTKALQPQHPQRCISPNRSTTAFPTSIIDSKKPPSLFSVDMLSSSEKGEPNFEADSKRLDRSRPSLSPGRQPSFSDHGGVWNRDGDRTDFRKRGKFDNRRPDKQSRVTPSSSSHSPRPPQHNTTRRLQTAPRPPAPIRAMVQQKVSIVDLLNEPGRSTRPVRVAIILRGLPGSGKTYLAKLIKDKEVEMGGAVPRVLSIDDYFLVENENIRKDGKTGRKIVEKVMEYEFDQAVEPSYRKSITKSFKKHVDDALFTFLIVDSVNQKIDHFDEMWSHAKQHGYQVYIADLQSDIANCVRRNIHDRDDASIRKIAREWDETPLHYVALDCTPLLQESSIAEVDMVVEDHIVPPPPLPTSTPPMKPPIPVGDNDDEVDTDSDGESDSVFLKVAKSKWEMDSDDKLGVLDGIVTGSSHKRKILQHQAMDEFLMVPEDYASRASTCAAGKKRVRWADIEEGKDIERQKAMGFVIGSTNWDKITDQYNTKDALEKKKYYFKD